MEIFKCYQTKSACYKRGRKAKQTGILVHSTGANNPELRRYVDAPERLGQNQYNNHWNKSTANKAVHAFIGRDISKKIIVAECLPYDITCWGCGAGKNGSYNRDPVAHIQFEICEGSSADAAYYWAVIAVAEEYCAHLCRLYGWGVDKITSHKEAHDAGFASNHGDPQNYMRHFGDDMNKFRARVVMRLFGAETPVETSEEKDEQTPAQDDKNENSPISGANTGIQAGTEVYTMKTLRNGSKGTQVRVLQFLLGGLEVDGIFGKATLAAVKAYQAAQGLTVDGIIGKNTWNALLK